MQKLSFEKIKAFLFDMDGVIVDSEKAWEEYEHKILVNLIGEDAYKFKNSLVGVSMKEVFKICNLYTKKISWDEFTQEYDQTAVKVYSNSKLTSGIEELLEFLKNKNKKIALVSASRQNWIDLVVSKFSKNYFDEVISVVDTEGLKDKPAPDGYLEAIKRLSIKNYEAVIVEDSNSGLMSAKEVNPAQIFAFAEHLVGNYKQIEVGQKVYNFEELKSYFDFN